MFMHTVTLYNKVDDGNWQRTVLSGAYWNDTKGATIRKTGVVPDNSLQLFISLNARTNRAYKPPKEWQALSDKSDFWTLQNGDIVVKGNVDYEIKRSPSELMSKFDNVRTITAVDDNAFGSLGHWEVSGK